MNIKNNLPNMFTLFNLSLGVLSILFIFSEKYDISALLILLAALFDRFDGKLARRFDAITDLGKELDSLCDLISFGVAPTILIWNIKLIDIGVIGIIITILYAVSGAYRLARYNCAEFDGVYYGIPITLSGGIISLVVLYSINYKSNNYLLAILMLLLSYTMISKRIRLKKR